MSETNLWRYFRCVGDNAIRRVRVGENATTFFCGGEKTKGAKFAVYLRNKNIFHEITESDAIDILGGCPWEEVKDGH